MCKGFDHFEALNAIIVVIQHIIATLQLISLKCAPALLTLLHTNTLKGKIFHVSLWKISQGQERSCKEWKVCVYLRRKHVRERLNCAAECLHKPSIFPIFFFSPFSSQTKSLFPGNHLACLCVWEMWAVCDEGLRECDLPKMETETRRDRARRALQPSALSTFREIERGRLKREIKTERMQRKKEWERDTGREKEIKLERGQKKGGRGRKESSVVGELLSSNSGSSLRTI